MSPGIWKSRRSVPLLTTTASKTASKAAAKKVSKVAAKPAAAKPAKAVTKKVAAKATTAKVVAASAPLPRSPRVASLASNPMSGADDTTLGKTGAITTRRIKQASMNDLWMRAMILAPNVSTSLSTSILGDQDMTVLRTHFVKPNVAVAMTFSNDPQMGIVCEKFTGPATAKLSTTAFALRTASLRAWM